jgi:hypothetical protein
MDQQFLRRKKKPSTDGFKTPEQVAAIDKETTATPLINVEEDKKPEISAPVRKVDIEGKKSPFSFMKKLDRKQALIITCVVIVLAGVGLLAYKHFNKTTLKIQTAKIAAKPVSTTVASDLSGLQVDPSLNKLPVTAVMVENSIDARPQSGLSQAMVVFEAVAEGGVTRFMALYQDTSPSSVGPIRSARPYYVAWSMGFDAGYAHVGGSPDALSDITSWNTRDLNQFSNGSYYTRVSSRAAPHNVYTSISELNQLENKKGYTSSSFTSWARKTEAPLTTPSIRQISMSLSGPIYNPTYIYNSKNNTYYRNQNGAPMMDALNNTQISPKVVIAIVVPETQGALDATGAYYSNYNYTGSGAAYVFQDGGMTQGTWTKSSTTSQILFTTSTGQPLTLNPGQVWITAVTGSSSLTYS